MSWRKRNTGRKRSSWAHRRHSKNAGKGKDILSVFRGPDGSLKVVPLAGVTVGGIVAAAALVAMIAYFIAQQSLIGAGTRWRYSLTATADSVMAARTAIGDVTVVTTTPVPPATDTQPPVGETRIVLQPDADCAARQPLPADGNTTCRITATIENPPSPDAYAGAIMRFGIGGGGARLDPSEVPIGSSLTAQTTLTVGTSMGALMVRAWLEMDGRPVERPGGGLLEGNLVVSTAYFVGIRLVAGENGLLRYPQPGQPYRIEVLAVGPDGEVEQGNFTVRAILEPNRDDGVGLALGPAGPWGGSVDFLISDGFFFIANAASGSSGTGECGMARVELSAVERQDIAGTDVLVGWGPPANLFVNIVPRRGTLLLSLGYRTLRVNASAAGANGTPVCQPVHLESRVLLPAGDGGGHDIFVVSGQTDVVLPPDGYQWVLSATGEGGLAELTISSITGSNSHSVLVLTSAGRAVFRTGVVSCSGDMEYPFLGLGNGIGTLSIRCGAVYSPASAYEAYTLVDPRYVATSSSVPVLIGFWVSDRYLIAGEDRSIVELAGGQGDIPIFLSDGAVASNRRDGVVNVVENLRAARDPARVGTSGYSFVYLVGDASGAIVSMVTPTPTPTPTSTPTFTPIPYETVAPPTSAPGGGPTSARPTSTSGAPTWTLSPTPPTSTSDTPIWTPSSTPPTSTPGPPTSTPSSTPPTSTPGPPTSTPSSTPPTSTPGPPTSTPSPTWTPPSPTTPPPTTAPPPPPTTAPPPPTTAPPPPTTAPPPPPTTAPPPPTTAPPPPTTAPPAQTPTP